MPLGTNTLNFDDEVQRLREKREELLDRVAALDPDNPEAARLEQRGQNIDDYLAGLRWARDEAYEDPDVSVWDADADAVTLCGLTGGEYAGVEDDVRSAALEREQASASGTSRVYMVAHGTVDAPYHDEDYSDAELLAATQQLPYQFLKWAEMHINRMTTVGGQEGNQSFSAAVAERRREMSTDEPN
ncbi:hypothetical protein [Halobellus sp. H-GB7]|uniref:hypothetical protein n=1 Tax=Halobellus sp. H-GB7 TaxID=3069756 RepID=UPI0027B425D6|nr:hypothetical protein [Halobellus sp. H-GB7]MDQ2053233.1 hypothetical protein [Halobellus sp. H-GB7]